MTLRCHHVSASFWSGTIKAQLIAIKRIPHLVRLFFNGERMVWHNRQGASAPTSQAGYARKLSKMTSRS